MSASLLLLLTLASAHLATLSWATSFCDQWSYTVTHSPSIVAPVTLTDPVYLPPSDDDVNQVDLPYSFPFYGQSYTAINVSTNGNIQFNSESVAWVDLALPFSLFPSMLAFYFVDLNPDETWMQMSQTIGQAPHRFTLIRYEEVPLCPFGSVDTHNDTSNDTEILSQQPSITCDVLLYETTGVMEVRYYSVEETPAPVVIGVQSVVGDNMTVESFSALVNHQPITSTMAKYLNMSTVTFTPQCQVQDLAGEAGGSTTTPANAATSAGSLTVVPLMAGVVVMMFALWH